MKDVDKRGRARDRDGVNIARLVVSAFFGVYFASSFFVTPIFHRAAEDVRILRDKETESSTIPVKEDARADIGPGLLFKVQMERRALGLMQDPLLESDSRPDHLFRSIERSLFADSALLTINLLWCVLLFVSAWTAWTRRWFARPLQVMAYVPSVLWLLVVLFSVRRTQLESIPINGYAALAAGVESALIIAGVFLIMESSFPEFGRGMDFSFMGHSKSAGLPTSVRVTRAASVTLHLAVIAVAGLAASNFVLLPMFLMQQSFPRFFVLLLAAGLLLLAFFYVRAYRRVSPGSSVSTSGAFLGFRVLTNSMFLTGVLSLIAVVLGVTVVLALANTDALQWTGILAKPGKL